MPGGEPNKPIVDDPSKVGHQAVIDLDRLMANTPVCMAFLDFNGKYLWVNQAFAAIKHQTSSVYPGKYHFDLFPDSEIADMFNQVIQTGETHTIYGKAFTDPDQPEAGILYLDWTLQAKKDEAQASGVLLILVDATERVRAEDELRKTQFQYEHIFESSPDANLLVDASGNILAVNRITEKLFGYRRHELIGKPVDTLLPERFRKTHVMHRTSYSRSPRMRPLGQGLNLVGLRKNGEEFPVDITLSPSRMDKGLQVLAVIRDISARRQSEIALQEQTAFVKLLSDVAVAANEAESVEAALLFTLDRVCGHTDWTIGHAILRNAEGILESTPLWHLDDSQFSAEFKKVSEGLTWRQGEGLPGTILKTGKAIWYTDIDQVPSFKRKAISELMGIKSAFAFPIWSGREVLGVLEFFSTESMKPQPNLIEIIPGIGTQIGRVIERKRVEIERRSQENLLFDVLNTLPVGVWVADKNGRIIMTNTAGENIWGDYHGVGLDRFGDFKGWWPQSGKSIKPEEWALSRAFREGETTLDELIAIETFDGIRKTVLNSAFPLRDTNGEIFGAIVVNQDVTERNQMEAELAEVKRRLLENAETERLQVARELHDGPIQELYSTTFLIQDATGDMKSDEGVKLLGQARVTVQQAISMLRVICGDLRPPALAPFGLEKAIRSHAEYFMEVHPSIKVHLKLDKDNQILPEPTRLALFRIYQQLLTNIVRHAQASEAWVRFELQQDEVILEVEDDGVGFNPSTRWIDLARQGHLGLVGATERAESLGGNLTIESAPGHGTVIRATIPREPTGGA